MSDFDPSRRSSKRRKIHTPQSDSLKTETSPSNFRILTRAAKSVSRRLFNTKHEGGEAPSDNGQTSPSSQDPAYILDKNLLDEDDIAGTKAHHHTMASSGELESEDELARSGLTVTPSKMQQHTSGLSNTADGDVAAGGDDNEKDGVLNDSPIRTRSSGRRRRPTQQFGIGQPDLSRTSVASMKSPSGSTDLRLAQMASTSYHKRKQLKPDVQFDFKDIKTSARKPSGKLARRQVPDSSVWVLEDNEDDHGLVEERAKGGEQRTKIGLDDLPVPNISELSEIVSAQSMRTSPSPSPVARDSRLDVVKTKVLSRLAGHSFTPLTHHDVEYKKLNSLLAATVKRGEGNSILLLGSRGVGKTCLVESAIADLAIENAEDFHVVRLNGFLQTDDKLALQEIWRQLGREMQIEEGETAQVNSYADTMASLLYLLSHPEELAITIDPEATSQTTKSVIFVLDEFDLFTSHSRQTLLYNLFDIAQSRKAPIAVVGCTARVDVSDNLEKRVKSRFSHRWIHLSAAKSLVAFEDIAKAALLLEETGTHCKEQSISRQVRLEWNTFIEVCF
jgi:GTPase SAR1 family protein